jgi:hypothetical protein
VLNEQDDSGNVMANISRTGRVAVTLRDNVEQEIMTAKITPAAPILLLATI